MGTGISPICHCLKKPWHWHVPMNCLLLYDLNLKLVKGPPSTASSAPALATPAPAPTPSPGGNARLATTPLDGSSGSGCAPSSLMALTAGRYAPLAEEYESDNNFHWAGYEDGVVYDVHSASTYKSNSSVAFYLSCNHAATTHIGPATSSLALPVPGVQSLACITLPNNLPSLIAWMSRNSISPGSSCRFSVANMGATNRMTPKRFSLYF